MVLMVVTVEMVTREVRDPGDQTGHQDLEVRLVSRAWEESILLGSKESEERMASRGSRGCPPPTTVCLVCLDSRGNREVLGGLGSQGGRGGWGREEL